MAVGVALGDYYGRFAIGVHSQKTLYGLRRYYPVYGKLDAAAGAVFEAYGHAEAAAHLPVSLALCSAGAHGSPGVKVCQVLGRYGVYELYCGKQAHFAYLQQELTGHLQPGGDVEAAVEARVIYQPLPPNSGARLLKVHAHDYENLFLQLIGQAFKLLSVRIAGLKVVNGAGPRDHNHPVVFASQDASDLLPAVCDELGYPGCDGVLLNELPGRNQGLDALDIYVV